MCSVFILSRTIHPLGRSIHSHPIIPSLNKRGARQAFRGLRYLNYLLLLAARPGSAVSRSIFADRPPATWRGVPHDAIMARRSSTGD